MLNNDFTNYLTKRLTALNFANMETTGINFESVSQMTDSLSIFEAASKNVSAIDYTAIANALNQGDFSEINDEGTKSIASVMSEILSVQGVAENSEIFADETIDAEEIEAFIKEIAGGDGDLSNLTLEDIDALFEKMGINLDQAAEDTVNEVIDELSKQLEEEVAKIETEKAEAIEKANTAQQAQSPASSAGGSTNAGNVGSASRVANSANKVNTSEAETVDEIKTEISEKEDEIAEVEEDAEAQIQEQEEAKKEAMEKAGVSAEEYEEYKKQADEKEEAIKGKEEAISQKDDEIRDCNATITSNQNYIESIDAQISENESAMDSISDDDENADSKRADAEAQIANLEAERAKIEEENTQLEEQISQAEQDKHNLEAEKEKLEQEKQELLSKTLDNSKGFAKGVADSGAVSQMKNTIASYDENISKIKEDKETKISSIKDEIQTLQVKLKDAEALEQRAEVIKDNAFTNGLGLTGEELVEVAKQMLAQYGESSGYCATGVSRTFQMAYGLSLHGNGCDWDSNMDNLVEQGAFKEVTGDYETSADLANLPAGAVVCWEATGGSDGGAKYGHVCIADGNGGEISDHYQANIYKSIGGRSDQYRVYIPV